MSPSDYRAMVNAARDLADSFHRFERDMDRFRRLIAEAKISDGHLRMVEAAVQEGCDNPRRRKAIEAINQRLSDLGVQA